MTQDTKTALLDAAETALRRRGYDGFSYADLAQAVGIRKASIHYHFQRKTQLAADVMTRYHEKVLSCCQMIDAASPNGAAKLLGFVEFYREATAGGQQLCLCVALSGTPDSLTAHVTQATNTFRSAVLAWLEIAFEEAARDGTVSDIGAAIEEAAALLALLEGAQLSARASQNVGAFDLALTQFKARCADIASPPGG